MDQKAADIIDKLLSADLSEKVKSNLERELEKYPELHTVYLQLKEDNNAVFHPSEIQVNPYLFQKIKLRMQHNVRSFPVTSTGRAWVPYAALLSFGIMSGVFLGNQVEIGSVEESEEITSEIIVDDYELEEAYLIDYSNE